MNTSKPISTISYNSESFLVGRLNEYSKLLSFWAAIRHTGEDDEGGAKDHWHVYAEPAKRFQTDSLDFSEPDPLHPDKPLCCISWRSSKFADWYLYVLHDQQYLSQKGLLRKYHYKPEDFLTSDKDDLNYLAKSIDRLSVSPYMDMLQAIENHYTWQEYMRRGCVPIQLVRQYKYAWDALQNAGAFQEFTDSVEAVENLLKS